MLKLTISFLISTSIYCINNVYAIEITNDLIITDIFLTYFISCICNLKTAGVIASGWYGWCAAFSMLRLSLKWILLGDSRLFGTVSEAFLGVKVLLREHTQLDKLAAVDIVGFNGPSEQFTQPLHFGSLYLWDWGLHLRWPGWVFVLETICHVMCGGVSDLEGIITIGSSATGPAILSVFHVGSLLGDLGSILESKPGGEEFCTAPSLEILDKTVVRKVEEDCYHPRGLFPLATLDANIIAHLVFGQESKMVKRMLTLEEALQVYDVSPSVYGWWSKSSKRAWCCPC